MHTGLAAHLLPKTGRSGPSSTDSGEDLYGYSAILKKKDKKGGEEKMPAVSSITSFLMGTFTF